MTHTDTSGRTSRCALQFPQNQTVQGIKIDLRLSFSSVGPADAWDEATRACLAPQPCVQDPRFVTASDQGGSQRLQMSLSRTFIPQRSIPAAAAVAAGHVHDRSRLELIQLRKVRREIPPEMRIPALHCPTHPGTIVARMRSCETVEGRRSPTGDEGSRRLCWKDSCFSLDLIVHGQAAGTAPPTAATAAAAAAAEHFLMLQKPPTTEFEVLFQNQFIIEITEFALLFLDGPQACPEIPSSRDQDRLWDVLTSIEITASDVIHHVPGFCVEGIDQSELGDRPRNKEGKESEKAYHSEDKRTGNDG